MLRMSRKGTVGTAIDSTARNSPSTPAVALPPRAVYPQPASTMTRAAGEVDKGSSKEQASLKTPARASPGCEDDHTRGVLGMLLT